MPLRTLSLLIAAALYLITSVTLAGNTLTIYQLPGPVVQAFRKAYPAAANPKYQEDKEKDVRVFVIEFEFEGMEHKAVYRGDGKLLRIEREEEEPS